MLQVGYFDLSIHTAGGACAAPMPCAKPSWLDAFYSNSDINGMSVIDVFLCLRWLISFALSASLGTHISRADVSRFVIREVDCLYVCVCVLSLFQWWPPALDSTRLRGKTPRWVTSLCSAQAHPWVLALSPSALGFLTQVLWEYTYTDRCCK